MSKSKRVRVVLIGGSGYAGFEVIRLLLRHPAAGLVGIFGPANELGPMEQFYPLLSKQVRLSQELFDIEKVAAAGAELAMLCVPHKVAMSYVPQLRKRGIRCIDWSADYRL
jgi:N-acetyl-gamma-glutamyl-phosphate reductase